MTDAKHTPEPWDIEIFDEMGYEGSGFIIFQADMPREEAPVVVQRRRWKNGKADGLRIMACVNACRGMADPAAEIAALRTEVDHLRQWIGLEQYRSDSRSAADLRAKMEHYRSEATALRRNESEAIDAIKAVGYVTPHGESDSLGEAVAWLVAEAERLRKDNKQADAENLAHRKARWAAIDMAVKAGYTPNEGNSADFEEAVAWLVKAVEAGDRMADNLTALASDIERGDALAVRAFVRDYRKERAS